MACTWLVVELFKADDPTLSGLHHKGIPLQVEIGRLPFMLQLLRRDGDSGITIRCTDIVDQMGHSLEVAPLNGTQTQA